MEREELASRKSGILFFLLKKVLEKQFVFPLKDFEDISNTTDCWKETSNTKL